MNKFALAAIGIVSAKQNVPHRHIDFGMDHNINALDTVSDFVFGENSQKPACNLQEGDRMDDFVFYRKMVGGILNAGVKGMYHETTVEPIAEDCFGDWIDSDLDEIADTV